MRYFINLVEQLNIPDQKLMIDMARDYEHMIPHDDPRANLPADRYVWTHYPNYPIAKFDQMTPAGWKEWMQNEIAMWADEGEPDRFDDMLTGEIFNEVIAVEIDNHAFIWDGHHRVASSYFIGRLTVPAIIGRLPR